MKVVDNGIKTVTDKKFNIRFNVHYVTKYLPSAHDIANQIGTDAHSLYRLTQTARVVLRDLIQTTDSNNKGHVNIKSMSISDEVKWLKYGIPNATKKTYLNAVKLLNKKGLIDDNGWLTFNSMLNSDHIGVLYHTKGFNGIYVTYVDSVKQRSFNNMLKNTNNNMIQIRLGAR